MKIVEIKEIAKQHGIKVSKLNKTELVRAIQLSEGNIPCFNSNISEECGQYTCLWHDDCA